MGNSGPPPKLVLKNRRMVFSSSILMIPFHLWQQRPEIKGQATGRPFSQLTYLNFLIAVQRKKIILRLMIISKEASEARFV